MLTSSDVPSVRRFDPPLPKSIECGGEVPRKVQLLSAYPACPSASKILPALANKILGFRAAANCCVKDAGCEEPPAVASSAPAPPPGRRRGKSDGRHPPHAG